MALTNTTKQVSSLKINKVPSASVYASMLAQNLVNDDELYLVQETEHVSNKYTFNVSSTQSTFTIPFDYDDTSALSVFYNGVLMKETENYTISNKVITLNGFTASSGDYITVIGIEGLAMVDVDSRIGELETAVASAKTEISTAVSNAESSIDEKVRTALQTIDASIPSDTANIIYKNKATTMTSAGKITMDSSYVPTGAYDLATKTYVDNSTPSVVGTTTNYCIYIGKTAPASGTTPLLWIDTTTGTGVFKYRTTTTGTWTPVPVAWG